MFMLVTGTVVGRTNRTQTKMVNKAGERMKMGIEGKRVLV